MTSRDFCFWLQGHFELQGAAAAPISAEQAQVIRAHLALVFKHEIDPAMGDAKHQAELNAVHTPAKPPQKEPWQHPQQGGGLDGSTLLRC